MESSGKKVRVLAVDDSKTMLAMMSAYLKGSNFELVATANSGAEALEKYKELKPQLVLLDVVMPEVDGLEILENILGTDTGACVIMVSSLGTENTVQDCLKKGAKSFVQKPIQKAGMLATLKTVCQEAGVAL
ncbi:MAG TPA: response regulator [Candidatus Limnocylindrales bacterium]|nr:response regulator [Candidatus Limnocylindrales bacterium]